MLNLISIFLAIIFLTKLLWNVAVVYMLELDKNVKMVNEQDGPRSVSMALGVELTLWVFLITISMFSDGNLWINQTGNVFLYGGGAIIVSYLFTAIVGFWTMKQ